MEQESREMEQGSRDVKETTIMNREEDETIEEEGDTIFIKMEEKVITIYMHIEGRING